MPAVRKFETAYQRIRWAQNDIIELRALMREFFNSQSYSRIFDIDPETFHVRDKIKVSGIFPEPMIRLSVQIAENLRSSLDHAACAVVPAGKMRKRTSFPFGDTKRDFELALKSKCKYVPSEIKSLFAAFMPYKRGTSHLWALNQLCNTTKHRTIIRPGIFVKDIVFEDVHGVGEPNLLPHVPRWNRKKSEIVVSTAINKGTIHHDVELSLTIAFGKVPLFQGKPALPIFTKLLGISQKIVRMTEVKARRISVM